MSRSSFCSISSQLRSRSSLHSLSLFHRQHSHATSFSYPLSFSSQPYRFIWEHLGGDLQAKQVDFSQIPIVDLAPFIHNNKSNKDLQSSIDSLRSACRDVGFFYIHNHSLSPSLLNEAFIQVKNFFSSPLEKKMEISCQNRPNRGYFPLHGENLGEKEIGDYKEGVDIGRDLTPEEQKETSLQYQLPNTWPSDMPEFKSILQQYFSAMHQLSITLTRALELALSIEEEYFSPFISHPMASLRLTHYPPQSSTSVTDSHLGAGAHTDYGLLTIVAQTSSGLQVRNRKGEWINAPVIPGTLIVNLGDMMQRFTNGYFTSTPHRVINERTGQSRYSMPFFFEPNIDADIKAHPKFISSTQPSLYTPIIFGEHLKNMYNHTYKKTSTSQSQSE